MTLRRQPSNRLLLLSLFTSAAGCNWPSAEEFIEERERIACEIRRECGEFDADMECDGLGYELDSCTKYHPSRANDCLDAMESLLDDVQMSDDPESSPSCGIDNLPYECHEVLENRPDRKGCGSVHGRPFRDEHGLVLPECVEGSNWSSASPDDVVGRELAVADRARAVEQWIEAARTEHASMAAFHRLATQLMVLGAPAALIGRAHAAASDELRHTIDTLGVARRLSGRPLDLGALRWSPDQSAPTLRSVALESFVDGCIGEAVAAARAWTAARHADPSVRGTLQTIARDELEHACLAWAVVGWAAANDPSIVVDLDRALRRHEASLRDELETAAPDGGVLALGVLDRDTELRLELGLLTRVIEPALRRVAAEAERGSTLAV